MKRILIFLCMLIAFLSLFFAPLVMSGCKDPKTVADVEAGITVANDTCKFLEGVTDNQTLINVCATVEEIAWMVGIFAPLLKPAEQADASTCKPVPSTKFCATPRDTGRMIQGLVSLRHARLMLDASP